MEVNRASVWWRVTRVGICRCWSADKCTISMDTEQCRHRIDRRSSSFKASQMVNWCTRSVHRFWRRKRQSLWAVFRNVLHHQPCPFQRHIRQTKWVCRASTAAQRITRDSTARKHQWRMWREMPSTSWTTQWTRLKFSSWQQCRCNRLRRRVGWIRSSRPTIMIRTGRWHSSTWHKTQPARVAPARVPFTVRSKRRTLS